MNGCAVPTSASSRCSATACCLCSMFLRQVGQCFPAVWAAGSRSVGAVWTGGLCKEGIGPPNLYIPGL